MSNGFQTRSPGARRRPAIVVALILAAAALLLYLPVRGFDYIECDDPGYVRDNWMVHDGFSRRAVAEALRSLNHGFWVPATWLSYMADARLQGASAGAFHLTNALLHAANVLLLLLLLESATGLLWPAATVAAVLAFHPLHVESVAWITERKDVLSLFFGLLSLRSYVHYTRRPSTGRYLAVFALHFIALASKPMMVILPALMLLLDWWPLNRSGVRGRLLVEKLPLLAISAAAAGLTYLGHLRTASLHSFDEIPLTGRLGNAASYLGFYLQKAFWPVHLGMYYYDPWISFPLTRVLATALVLVFLTVSLLMFRRRWPAGVIGWAWFVAGLMPVIGFVRPGDQTVADRFMYLPLIGLSVALAWGLRSVARTPALRAIAAASVVVVLSLLAAQASSQLSYWKDGESLFRHSVAVSPDSETARIFLAGSLAAGKGKLEEAESEYRTVLARNPASARAWRDLGVSLHYRGRYREALEAYALASRLDPSDDTVILFEGQALLEMGDMAAAEERFRRALEIRPGDADRLANLGTLLAETNREMEAERLFLEALASDPLQRLAGKNLGVLRAKQAGRKP